MGPAKIDTTTPSIYGRVMIITMVEPLPAEPDMMLHTFKCPCGELTNSKFPKRVVPGRSLQPYAI